MSLRIGIVGARGYVGGELIRLILAQDQFQLAFVSSRARCGLALSEFEPDFVGDLRYVEFGPEAVAHSEVDAVVLALPNGLAAPFVAAIDRICPEMIVVDLSADYRFDSSWHYGLPEANYAQPMSNPRRISNPGCYATAMQLAILPLRDRLQGAVQCFGVSGFSGAGTAPSPKNDPLALADNLMPYALINHVHEREVSKQLGHIVEFMPHVAPHFRGIMLTANLHFAEAQTREALWECYVRRYAASALVHLSDDAPWVSQIAGQQHASIGGLTVSADGLRAVVVCVLDNLLKGAATQAVQNLNLALGQPEYRGILS